MKKIILLFITILLGTSIIKVNATAEFKSIFIWYYHYVDENGKFGDFEIFKRANDEKIAYCIEPGVPLSNESYQEYKNLSKEELQEKFGITDTLLKTISLYAYYGYGYNDHQKTDWLVATQVKIWELLGRKIQFTSKNNEQNPYEYVIETPQIIKEMMDELDKLVTKHQQLPSISNMHFKIPYGESYEIKDDLLAKYDQITNNEEVIKKDNIITITPTKKTTKETIILEKKNNYWSQDFILYHHEQGQNLLLIGNIPNDKIEFSYETIKGKIKIQKYDQETKKCEKEFDNVIYGIYTENNILIEKLKLTNCETSYDSLKIGKYYLKEISAPINYELDETKYFFEITKENIEKQIEKKVYNKKKLILIKINKKYLYDTFTYLNEKNAVFDIVDNITKQVIKTLQTDEYGNAQVTLPYGKYTIIQKKGQKNYKFTPDIPLTINEYTEEDQTIFIKNEPIMKKVKIIKLEKNSNKKIKLANIKFKIYDKERKKYICENKECTFNTNELGEFTTQDLFPSTYILEEINDYLPNLFWNDKKIEFTINENSKDIIEIPFYNEKKLTKIEINKKDNDNIPLENIEFSLYAKEDIYDIDKALIYKKDDLIKTIKTNKLGQACFDNLDIASYYIKETSQNSNYQKNNKIYFIDFNKEQNLSYKLDIINYKIPKTKKNKYLIPIINPIIGGCIIYEKKKHHRRHYINT